MIDPKIQADLRAKYNPDGSSLRQHQLRIVKMLKYFDELCQKHGIRYWLSSGNCLGLVRHGGFIPWDDDIDVEMLQEDYIKLLDVFQESDDYVLQTWKNDSKYFYAFAKMRDKHSFVEENNLIDRQYKYRGVFIDIFPLENTFFCGSYFCSVFTRHILFRLVLKNGIFYKILFKVSKRIGFYILFPFCRFLGNLMFKKKELRHMYGTEWIFNIRRLQDIYPLKRAIFEGVEVFVPNNLDNYLKNIYGNYMELPSQEKILGTHIRRIDLF